MSNLKRHLKKQHGEELSMLENGNAKFKTMTSYLIQPLIASRKARLDSKLVALISVANLPMNFVERPSFRDFIEVFVCTILSIK